MNTSLNSIRTFCDKYRVSYLRVLFAKRFLFSLSLVLFLLSAIQSGFALFPWIAFPLLWDMCVASLLFCATGILVDFLYIRKITTASIAHRIEQRAKLPHPWLSLSLELAEKEHDDLHTMIFEKACDFLPQCSHNEPFSLGKRSGAFLVSSVIIFFVTFLSMQPRCASFFSLPLILTQTVTATISPGSICIPNNSSCILSCKPSANIPSCKIKLFDSNGNLISEQLLASDNGNAFSLIRKNVSASFSYQFIIGKKSFKKESILVVPRPFLSVLQVQVTPPVYTGIKPFSLSDGQGNISVYSGSRVSVQLESPYALSHAVFISSNGDSLPCFLTGKKASLSLSVYKTMNYTFALTDTFGQKSDSIPHYTAEIIPDLLPVISFLKPGDNLSCLPAEKETLLVDAIDDIGLSSMSVLMRKNHDSTFSYFTKSCASLKSTQIGLVVNLSIFSLYPDDTLFYWAVAKDNRTTPGFQVATTDTFYFRIPSIEEINRQVAQEQYTTEQALSSVREKQQDMAKTVRSLLQSTKNKSKLSWEQEQIMKDLKESVEKQADSLEKAVNAFKESVDKFKEQQQSAPPELLAKMDQIQKELEALQKKYGDSLFVNKQEKPDDVSMRDIRESLEKFKNMLPDLAQRLENTLKFLEMLKKDQALAKMATEAQQLAADQKNIASEADIGQQCNSKQEKQNAGVDSLLKKIDISAKDTNDSALFAKSQLPSLQDVAPLQSSMCSACKNKSMPTNSQMLKMSRSLNSLAGDLNNLQSCSLSKRMDKDRETLLSMTQDVLGLSGWQRQITELPRNTPSAAGDISMMQQSLKESLAKSMEKLNDLAMVPPRSIMAIKLQSDNTAQALSRSLDLLSQTQSPYILDGPQSNLNLLAKTVLDAIQELNNQSMPSSSSGSSGMMQGLRKLSGKQAALNGLTSQLLRKMLGQEGSEGQPQEGTGQKPGNSGKGSAQNEHAKQQAQAAQKEIADELKRLAEKYGKQSGESLDKKAKDLEEEARRLAREMEQPSQDLPEKQNQFLSRMLEASLSQHKQDEGKQERVSQSAQTVFSPATNKQYNTAYDEDSYYKLRQKAFSGNYPESYRLAVKNYFDSLGILYLKGK